MNLVYAIVVYGILHNVEMVLPQTYPDLQACQAALIQTHLTFGNWGQCQPLAAKPPMPDPTPAPKARYRGEAPWGPYQCEEVQFGQYRWCAYR